MSQSRSIPTHQIRTTPFQNDLAGLEAAHDSIARPKRANKQARGLQGIVHSINRDFSIVLAASCSVSQLHIFLAFVAFAISTTSPACPQRARVCHLPISIHQQRPHHLKKSNTY
jgi:hypothetical protein